MSQYVIEFGAEGVQAISEAIASCLPAPFNITVDEAGDFHYKQTECPLTQVVADLNKGTVASAVFRGSDERIRYALIHSPLYNNSGLSKWMGTIELGVDDWHFVWESLLARPELLFVCVGDEEGVELRDEHLSPNSFPWSEWPLLVGAVRSTEGSDWIIRGRDPQLEAR